MKPVDADIPAKGRPPAGKGDSLTGQPEKRNPAIEKETAVTGATGATGAKGAKAPHSTLREKGQITLPSQVRESLRLEPQDEVYFVQTEAGWVLRKGGVINPDQAWFWTERWQRMEREADADIVAGRVARFEDVESFLADLDAGR